MPQQPEDRLAREALGYIQSFRTEMLNKNQEKLDNFVEYFNMYSLKDDRRDIEPWMSHLQITGAFEFVERPFAIMTANTPSFELEATSTKAPMVELEPEILDDDEITVIKPALRIPFSEVYESDLNAMFKIRKMKQKTREFVKGCLIYGTYQAEITKDVVSRNEYEEILDENGETTTMNKKIVDKITPDVDLVEPFDVLVSPYARDPEDAIERFGGFGVVRNNVSIRELDEDVYFNIDQLRTTLSVSGDSDYDENYQKTQKDQIVAPNADNGDATGGTFDITELWCYFKDSLDEFGEEKKMILSMANGVLIRFQEVEDEECPFVVVKDQEVPGQYWGIGEIEPIHSNLIEENTIRNQRIDYDNRLLNEEWLVRTDSGVDVRQLVSKDHAITFADDISDASIRQVQRSSAPLASTGQDLDRLRRDMASTTGSIDTIASGGVGNVTNTATGERIREQNAIARYAAKMENIEFAIADIAKKMLRIKAEGLGDKEMVPVFVRGKWREVPAKMYKDLLDKYIVRVRAGSMNVRNSITERNDRIAMVNLALQAAQVIGPDAIDFETLYKDLFGTFPNADVDKIIPSKPPQLPTEQQAENPRDIPQQLPKAINELGMAGDQRLQQPELNQPDFNNLP